MVKAPRVAAGGFTLVEALIAVVLSTIVASLVTSVFLTQNQFYNDALTRSGMHDDVRGAASRVSRDLRAVEVGGVVEAEADSVVVRVPLVVGAVCGVDASNVYAYLPLGGGAVDPAEVDGWALRGVVDSWQYASGSWASAFQSSGGQAARTCAAMGADTIGATADFYRLGDLGVGKPAMPGDLLMLYAEVELKLAPSRLNPSSMGLFRGPPGGNLIELTSGLSGRSGFTYSLDKKLGYVDRVPGKGNLQRIEWVRVYIEGVAPAARAAGDSLSFDLTVTVPVGHGQ